MSTTNKLKMNQQVGGSNPTLRRTKRSNSQLNQRLTPYFTYNRVLELCVPRSGQR